MIGSDLDRERGLGGFGVGTVIQMQAFSFNTSSGEVTLPALHFELFGVLILQKTIKIPILRQGWYEVRMW